MRINLVVQVSDDVCVHLAQTNSLHQLVDLAHRAITTNHIIWVMYVHTYICMMYYVYTDRGSSLRSFMRSFSSI